MKNIGFILLFLTHALLHSQSDTYNGFYENKGQITDFYGNPNNEVLYLLSTQGLNVQLKKQGFAYDFYGDRTEQSLMEICSPKVNFHRIDFTFINANPKVEILPMGESKDYDNYYNVQGITNGAIFVHSYEKIIYKNLYDNIDVEFFVPDDVFKPVEYNFIVHPGGNLNDIRLKVEGAENNLSDNQIKINLRFGEVYETIPLSWIESETENKIVEVNYKSIALNTYGFELSESEFYGTKLVIDPTPVRKWATYYSGNATSTARIITTDALGNVYFTGSTNSVNNIATSGTYQSEYNPLYIYFVVKFNSDGQRIWGTYNNFNPTNIKVDYDFNVVMVGSTATAIPNFTTPNAYQPTKNYEQDGCLAKFNSQGLLEWATYYGGTADDSFEDVAFDSQNNMYVTGVSRSQEDIATPNGHQSDKFGGNPASILVKFTPEGQRVWGTYYYTSVSEMCDNHISPYIDNQGNIVSFENIGHWAQPDNYKTRMITFTPQGELIGEYTFPTTKKAYDIRVAAEHIYYYTITQLPIGYPFYHISKLNYNENQINWTFNTGSIPMGFTLDVNTSGDCYLFGNTGIDPYIFPEHIIITDDSYMPYNPPQVNKSLLMKLNPEGQKEWGTYYGGNDQEIYATGTVGPQGELYLLGTTRSIEGIATEGAFQTIKGSGVNSAYLVKFEDCESSAEIMEPTAFCIGNDIQLTASGGTHYSWTGPNGFTSNEQNPIISNTTEEDEGFYNCYISGDLGCYGHFITYIYPGTNPDIPPTPQVASLPTIMGLCSVSVSDVPLAEDSCGNIIEGITSDPLLYDQPGTYLINWVYIDFSGRQNTQKQVVIVDSTLGDVLYPNPYYLCSINNEEVLFDLTIMEDKLLVSDASLCFEYYETVTDAQQQINSIENPAQYLSNQVQQDIYVRIYDCNNELCYIVTSFGIGINNLPDLIDIPPLKVCVEFSEAIVDLNSIDELISTAHPDNPLFFAYYLSEHDAYNNLNGLSKEYKVTQSRTLYVRISHTENSECYVIKPFEIEAFLMPETGLEPSYAICDDIPLTINIIDNFDTYLWSNGSATSSITVTQSGEYFVELSKTYQGITCYFTKHITVIDANIATITDIEITDFNLNDNSIHVIVDGLGDFEYSINGITYQAEPYFDRLDSGMYTVFVKSDNGCGVISQPVMILTYPNYFTPNNDGLNDYWNIKYSLSEPDMIIYIYDRYGKLLYQFFGGERGWDGNNKRGELMPSNDYWFLIKRTNGKQHSGHFSLIR